MRKKRKCIIAGMMIVMLAVTGCGGEREADKDIKNEIIVVPVDERKDAVESSNVNDTTDSIDDVINSSTDNTIPENDRNAGSDTMENIGGKVKSISQDSFVLSRVIVDENGMILVMPGEGGADELLTKVHCTDSTVYEHWTIQGGGAGIEKKEASFSDITDGCGLEAEGYFEGEEFIASKIIIEVYQ